MNNRDKIIQQAKDVIAAVNQEVKSSHQIISRFELPFVYEDEINAYEKKYGNIFSGFLLHTRKTDFLRITASKVIEILKLKPALVLAHLATAQFGFGEGSEKVSKAMIKLMQINFTETINRVTIDSTSTSDNHVFLITGDTKKLTHSVSSFQQLNDKCLLIDPLLNVVCQANCYLENNDLQRYYKLYNLTKISGNEKAQNISKNMIDDIFKKVELIYQESLELINISKMIDPGYESFYEGIINEQNEIRSNQPIIVELNKKNKNYAERLNLVMKDEEEEKSTVVRAVKIKDNKLLLSPFWLKQLSTKSKNELEQELEVKNIFQP